MSDPFPDGADQLLDALGSPATYHSLLSGALTLTAIVEKAVEVVDEGAGAYVRKPMITIKSGLVTPKRGDWLEIGTERWSVEQIGTDDGYLLQLWVRPKL